MDYSKIYIELIERAANREIDGYTERHHVVPRCMGGDDKPRNLVDLTPEEHYLAHQLLVKIYPNNKSLVYAAQMMGATRKGNKVYGWLRRKYCGIPKSPETRKKMSEAKSFTSPETRQKMRESQLGKKHSLESREKMSNSKTGKPLSPEARQKIKGKGKGRKQSPEHIEKRALSRSKTVFQIDRSSGESIAEFKSLNEAARTTKVAASDISLVCNGKQSHAGGFLWKFNQ